MMRMCLIICGSLDTLTGGFLYDKFLVMHLRQNGHKIDIVSLPWRWYGQHLLDNFSPKLRSGLISKTYDLILQDELSHPSLFLLNHRLRKYRDVPLVSIVHQVLSCQPRRYWMNILFKTIEKIYLTSVDAFIFNSETTRGRVQHLINFEGPSIVANPGGDRLGHLQAAEQIKARATQRGPLELVFVGNITPIKGLVPLLESLARLAPQIWRLTVVGSLSMDPGYVRRVKRLISEKKIRQQVDLAGPLDGNELINILSKSHLFVMPFSHEGFGIAYLEALAYGLPVLASTAGAVKEYIQPGQNGFLQTPDNPGVLCKHINNLYRDRDKLARMSSAALKTFHSRPNWKNTVESIQAFLEKLVA
jgi:glycosyltransferase involved in cell wall biosynthesis